MTFIRALDVIREELPPGAVIIEGGAGQYMEVTDMTNMDRWMCVSPVTQADYDGLAVDAPLRKSGIGKASMDCAAFIASPGLDHVAERVIDGWRFIHVATPKMFAPPAVTGGPMHVQVDKHHVLGFDAGRKVSILSTADGYFVELVGTDSCDEDLVLPPGSTLSQISLTKPWIVDLPTPTTAWFWMEKNVRSFQGPVTLPQDAVA